MNDYILLMHDDATEPVSGALWQTYFDALRASGVFEGGSAIGVGQALRKHQTPAPASRQLTGYIRVTADSLEAAKRFVVGNPIFECGGTVEVRELPRD